MKNKNKKGFLLGEETVKIIIAVICLVALVYFLASLYISNRNKDLELAQASLEKLITDINAGRTETEIYNPEGWGIASFSSSGNIGIPDFCLNKGWNNCICTCEIASGHTLITSCLTAGKMKIACSENDFFIKEEIRNPPLLLSINQNDKKIFKRE